jgi:hypothetical protein
MHQVVASSNQRRVAIRAAGLVDTVDHGHCEGDRGRLPQKLGAGFAAEARPVRIGENLFGPLVENGSSTNRRTEVERWPRPKGARSIKGPWRASLTCRTPKRRKQP